MRFMRFTLLLLMLLPAVSQYARADGGEVNLTDDAGQAILDNGVIRATINPSNARVTSIKFAGREMVNKDRQVYFSFAGGTDYEQPNHCVYSVAKRDADMVDVSCKRTYNPEKDKHAWDIDIHYILRKGDSGLYVYAVLEHKPEYPKAGFGEWRTIWFTPNDDNGYPVLEHICVDATRNWVMPGPDSKGEVQGIKEITKYTSGPWAGKYDCKYAYCAEYAQLRTWGWASDKNHLGAWMVLGSADYLNDGPTKQDLTSAQGYILQHLNMNHYGAGGVEVDQGQSWRKVYGPWLLYVTNEPTVEANWNAAKKRADAEKAAWPYAWLTDPDYAADTRGSASGRLVVHDPLKPKVSAAGAWVGLAQSEKKTGKNWQFQADAYQYWTKAKPDGSFTIPAVRPGTYTLYAFTTGAVGEYSQEDVTVSARHDTNLNTVTWTVPHQGSKIAWEIGIPDRTAAEFRHSKDYWLPYLFTRFSSEFSNPLVYDCAKGDWATAINYAQSNYNKQPWPWQLNFDLREQPKGDATLTIAFAGSNAARLDLQVNGHKLESLYPPNQGGNALLREGVHAKYGLSYVTIPAKDLQAGHNTLSLTQGKTEGDASHIMYDYINLELP